jgi:hypothetical protein
MKTTRAADDSLYIYLLIDFKLAMRFPLRAKIPLSTGILLLIALGWDAWGIIRDVMLKPRSA